MPEAKTNALRRLDAAHIAYTPHTYSPDDGIDGVSVARKLGEPVERVYKTLVTKGAREYFVFVIPVAEELDRKAAAKAVGEKAVDLIPVKDLLKTTGYVRGGCSPVGMKKPFVTVIDQSARDLPAGFVSGGRIGLQVELSPRALAEHIGATFAPITMAHP